MAEATRQPEDDADREPVRPDPNSPNAMAATYFDVLPTEMLMKIADAMPAEDRIQVAFVFPHLFWNDNTLNLIALDANEQLSIPTYVYATLEKEQSRQPLIHAAISSGKFSVEQIGQMLDQYEEVCKQRQVDPNIFVNCTFPSNAPGGMPPLRQSMQRKLVSPLHVAVQAARLDVVKHLVRRGADVNQRHPNLAFDWMAPLEWAIHLADSRGRGNDAEETRQFEDIAIELVRSSRVTAYGDARFVRNGMAEVIRCGMERLAIRLLERFEELDTHGTEDRTSAAFRTQRSLILERALSSRHAQPALLRYMLDHGAQLQFNAGLLSTVTVTEAAVARAAPRHPGGGGPSAHVENAAAALRWEHEHGVPSLAAALRAVAYRAGDDLNIRVVMRLVRELVALGLVEAQRQMLRRAIEGGRRSVETRRWLLRNTAPEAGDAMCLGRAVYHWDRETAAFLQAAFLRGGRPVDEPLAPPRAGIGFGTGHLVRRDGWLDTPLTFAILQENYYEAARMLSYGADPARVPVAVRQSVRSVADAVRFGMLDPVDFVFHGIPDPDGSMPSREAAMFALDSVFVRFLDNPAYPLPEELHPNDRDAADGDIIVMWRRTRSSSLRSW
ncbi:hypothetical protein SAMD00023353_2500180 [Rosellinia necatrix]|uniref:Uncharacterized protein n=1 Tax=Rosellinia necatrix TaxID=77044 RepID=A0A1W2TG97_ROSNE|nr:hypothetical protein SAMD00023353_2500180 [Rosellinia necatrix]